MQLSIEYQGLTYAFAIDLGLWLIAAAGCLTLFWHTFRRLSVRQLVELIKDESGAGYTINYLMTLPLYILFIAFFIEMSFIVTCRMGTVYAAFAAARVGIVWDGIQDESTVDEKVAFAGRRAFVPFANGLTQIRDDKRSNGETDQEAEAFTKLYTSYNKATQNDRVYQKYVHAKYRYAMRNVDVSVERIPGKSGQPWDQDFQVTVRYPYAFGTLGIGRIIGDRGTDGRYYHNIASTVTLKAELPMNEETALGIDYY